MSDGFFDRLFHPRARDIAAVDGPTRVELACRVASPDVVVSSVTGMEAALVRWSLLEERTVHPDRGGGAERGYRVLERGLYGDGAVLVAFAGQAIEVPLETWMAGDSLVPKRTIVAPRKLLPVMVMKPPPVLGPLLGVRALTDGTP